MSAPPLGLTYASIATLGLQTGPEIAKLAEDLGYRSFWTAETTGADAFTFLATAGAAAPTLGLGTGIVPMQIRTPMVAAMAAATLQAFRPDQEIVLGIGVSSPVITERWHGVPYGDRLVSRVREYVTLIKELLSGEQVSFEGDFYSVSRTRLGVRLRENRPKVVVGALNEKMLTMCGEVADGVLLNYLPASHVPWSVEKVREGERKAGREQGAAKIYAYVHAGLCEWEDGIDYARRDIWSYAVVDSYARSFERAGFAEEVEEIRGRQAERDRDGAVAAVSDRMVDAIDVMGDADKVRQTVVDYTDAGVDVPVLMPLPWGPDRRAVTEATMRAAIGEG